MNWQERTALVFGQDGINKLQNAHVMVFGVGGVGGYAVEALARAGVGKLTLIDADTVSDSNRNRQILALISTVGKAKVEVAAERIADINPNCIVYKKQMFYDLDSAKEISFDGVDYVIDAIDTVTAKLELLRRAKAENVRIISCMGTGNKLQPELLTVTTIEKTENCPLARVMRKECKNRGLKKIKVVYSPEIPKKTVVHVNPTDPDGTARRPRHAPGSVSFVPGTAGLILAGEVIRELTDE